MKTIKALLSSGTTTPKDRANANRVNLWMFAWIFVWLLLENGIFPMLGPGHPGALALMIVPIVLGIICLRVFTRFLREADELQRKIQLDALALSAGAILFCSILFSLLRKTGVIHEVEPAHVLLWLALSYMVGLIIGHRRYA